MTRYFSIPGGNWSHLNEAKIFEIVDEVESTERLKSGAFTREKLGMRGARRDFRPTEVVTTKVTGRR